MANVGNFDPNAVAPNTKREPVPQGDYRAMIVNSEEKPAKSGNGTYVEFTFELLDPPYAQRKIKTRLNLNNSNPEAVEIARGDLSAMAAAIGQNQMFTDSTVLHNRPLMIYVTVRPAHGQYDPSNEIKGYSAVGAAAAPAAGGQPAPGGAAPVQGGQAPAGGQTVQGAQPAAGAAPVAGGPQAGDAAPMTGGQGGTPSWAGQQQ